MAFRAERADLASPVQEFELVHRENALGAAVMYFMFAMNLVGVLAMAAWVVSLVQVAARSSSPGIALLAGVTSASAGLLAWAALAVVCGAVRYFNRRTFIRLPGKE